MQNPLFVLLASRLVSAEVWNPVAGILRSDGHDAIVTPSTGTLAPLSAAEALDAYAAPIPRHRPIILVAHSNAGNFVPDLISAVQVACVVFVDAVIPVKTGEQPLASPEMIDRLTALADHDGLLPPWHEWFGACEVAALFPDAASQQLIQARAPRLPLDYFKDQLRIKPGWIDTPCGYLAFGFTYAPEIARAQEYGWPVIRLNGRHLHMMVDPGSVAREIAALAEFLSGKNA